MRQLVSKRKADALPYHERVRLMFMQNRNIINETIQLINDYPYIDHSELTEKVVKHVTLNDAFELFNHHGINHKRLAELIIRKNTHITRGNDNKDIVTTNIDSKKLLLLLQYAEYSEFTLQIVLSNLESYYRYYENRTIGYCNYSPVVVRTLLYKCIFNDRVKRQIADICLDHLNNDSKTVLNAVLSVTTDNELKEYIHQNLIVYEIIT